MASIFKAIKELLCMGSSDNNLVGLCQLRESKVEVIEPKKVVKNSTNIKLSDLMRGA